MPQTRDTRDTVAGQVPRTEDPLEVVTPVDPQLVARAARIFEDAAALSIDHLDAFADELETVRERLAKREKERKPTEVATGAAAETKGKPAKSEDKK